MIHDLVTVERRRLARLEASNRAWKRLAKDYRKAYQLYREFSEGWYRAYRRAWKLDEPVIEELIGDSLRALGRWLKQLVRRSPQVPPKEEKSRW